MKELMDLLKKSRILRGLLVFFPYRWPDGGKSFSGSINIQRGWKHYHRVINNTYHGGHIETDHHVICLMPEDVENHFELPNFTTPIPGALREVLDNDITPRENIYLNGLGMTKGKAGG